MFTGIPAQDYWLCPIVIQPEFVLIVIVVVGELPTSA